MSTVACTRAVWPHELVQTTPENDIGQQEILLFHFEGNRTPCSSLDPTRATLDGHVPRVDWSGLSGLIGELCELRPPPKEPLQRRGGLFWSDGLGQDACFAG